MCWRIRTSQHFLRLTAEEYFQQIVVRGLSARAVVEGPNFFFGYQRRGDVEKLATLCRTAQVDLEIVEPVGVTAAAAHAEAAAAAGASAELLVSSSRIRAAIANGDLQRARLMLTEPYRIRGLVTHGDQRGTQLGFPTANLEGVDTLVPAHGVYAGRTSWAGRDYAAAIHIGPNPTFGEQATKLEVHVIDFRGDLYGAIIEVDFLSRLREIRRFAGVEELKSQLETDIQRARHVAAEIGHLGYLDTTGRGWIDMTVDWQRFAEQVRQHQHFLLTSHIRPDCDALGSELGMAAVLESIGKRVTIVNGQQNPPNLVFLDPEQRIRSIGETIQPSELADVDAIMILDTSAWAQLGQMAEFIQQSTAAKFLVDHHQGEDALGAEIFKNTSAEATGRLVVEAADALGVPLTASMATPLYAAIATDTGWFRFPSTTPTTYEVAARLVAAGARPAAIYAQLYEQETAGRVRLRGRILARVELELQGRLVHTYVHQSDYDEVGADPSDTEDAINLALAISGTEFAVIVVQQRDGSGCKISFRSRCDVDCSAVARHFNGGGHQKAAGAFLAVPLPEAQQQVLAYVRQQLQP